jgi:hypothetical protein
MAAACAVVLLAVFSSCGMAASRLQDDRQVTVHSKAEVKAKREQLIKYIWGDGGYPHQLMPVVQKAVPSPVDGLEELKRVDEFTLPMWPGLEGLAGHFMPQHPNGELIVLHQGHASTFNDTQSPEEKGFGMQRTIKALLLNGYGVLTVYMPHLRPGDSKGGHGEMFDRNDGGGPMKFFFNTLVAGLNFIRSRSGSDDSPAYRDYHMIGLSGGGWTTTVYAAIDPTIHYSFPVAGSIPLYLRSGGSVGDREQWEDSFYRIAGYPDLYVLGAAGAGRRQIQILNRHDGCCFGEKQHDAVAAGRNYDDALHAYVERVQSALQEIGQGSFRLVIDEKAPGHMISHHIIETVILPELRRARAGSQPARSPPSRGAGSPSKP